MTTDHEGWTIRRYRSPDKNAVWRVHDRSLRDSAMNYSPEYNRYLRHIPSAFLERDGEFLVVTTTSTDDRKIRPRTNGIVAIGGFQPLVRTTDETDAIRRAIERDGSTAHVRSIAVLPEVQSSGIGTRLVTELERRAAENGFSQVVLSTPVELDEAQGFYEARNYRVVHRENDADGYPAYLWYGKSIF